MSIDRSAPDSKPTERALQAKHQRTAQGDVLRICLWSGPRNVSTALMYSFAERADTRVVDEPLYAHYLRVSGAPHPGRPEVLAASSADGERVVREVILGASDRPVLFLKQMAHHLIELDLDFLSRVQNVILTRDPVEMLPSLRRQIPNPSLADTGLGVQADLLEHLLALGQDVPVLDAREVLLDPPAVLRTLCDRLGLPFDSGMLGWPAGPRPEDGVWAEHWYHAVHTSTGFRPYQPKSEPFPKALEPLLAECRPAYERLSEHAIRS